MTGLAVLFAAGLMVACSTGPKKPVAAPEATDDGPPVAAVAAQGCPVPEDICAFALRAERWVRLGDAGAIVAGSNWDNPNARTKLETLLRDTLGGEEMQLVSIGCPFIGGALRCGATFGLGFSTLPPGDDPRPGAQGILTLAFDRDPSCPLEDLLAGSCAPPARAAAPVLTGAASATAPDTRRSVLNGGLVQESSDLAGRPREALEAHLRSGWDPYFTSGRPAPVPPTELFGVRVRKMLLTGAADIPGQDALLIASGCYGCESYDRRLDRVYRDSAGILRRDTLLDPGRDITGIAIGGYTATIFATVCSRGYCGPLNAVTRDAQSELLRSDDGGVSWRKLTTFDGVAIAWAFVPDGPAGEFPGVVLERSFGSADPRAWDRDFYLWPGMKKLSPPPGAESKAPLTDPGPVTYRSTDGRSLLRGDGSILWTFPWSRFVEDVSILGDPPAPVISWAVTPRGLPRGHSYVGVLVGDVLTAVYSGGVFVSPLALENTFRPTAIGMAQISSKDLDPPNDSRGDFITPLPVFVDYLAGTVAPIEPGFFLDMYGPWDRKRVVGFVSGPFVRVNTPGDCLNLHEQPSLQSTVVDCVLDGVLLHDLSRWDAAPDPTWAPVLSPWGFASFGYVSRAYLER